MEEEFTASLGYGSREGEEQCGAWVWVHAKKITRLKVIHTVQTMWRK